MSTGKSPALSSAGPVPTASSAAAPGDGVSVGIRSVRDDMIDNVRYILAELLFKDKCLAVGVEPSKAEYTVDTAACADEQRSRHQRTYRPDALLRHHA